MYSSPDDDPHHVTKPFVSQHVRCFDERFPQLHQPRLQTVGNILGTAQRGNLANMKNASVLFRAFFKAGG
jgi:hypothetical protein